MEYELKCCWCWLCRNKTFPVCQIIMSHNIKLGAFQLSWAATEGREELILFMIFFFSASQRAGEHFYENLKKSPGWISLVRFPSSLLCLDILCNFMQIGDCDLVFPLLHFQSNIQSEMEFSPIEIFSTEYFFLKQNNALQRFKALIL